MSKGLTPGQRMDLAWLAFRAGRVNREKALQAILAAGGRLTPAGAIELLDNPIKPSARYGTSQATTFPTPRTKRAPSW